MQERPELPDPVTLVGVSLQDALLAVKVTIPLKPLSPVTLIVDAALFPLKVTELGLAVRAKSTTWNVEVAK